MGRQLATIQKIVNIKPIEGADRIECATVLSWEVVVNKADNFKVGSMVVYFEIDSLLPATETFKFMEDRKYRVRTIKLKKQISQGLVMPLSILPEKIQKTVKEGMDVSEVLGVTKYDPEGQLEEKLMQEKMNNSKNKVERFLGRYKWYRRIINFFFPKERNSFPSFIKKTDEERIQKLPLSLYEEYKKMQWFVTEKVDGCSATFFLMRNKNLFGPKYIFGVCSRNYQLKEDNSHYWQIAKKLKIKEVLTEMMEKDRMPLPYVVLQGEIIGPSIQKNKYDVKELDFYAYNLFLGNEIQDSGKAEYYLNLYNIKFVPILNEDYTLPETVSELVEFSNGNSVLNKNSLREGLVLRNYKGGEKISFKAISPKFLLKHEL